MLALVGIVAFLTGSALFVGTGAVWMHHFRAVQPSFSPPVRIQSLITRNSAEGTKLAKRDTVEIVINSSEVMLLTR
jgi:hypothetical protein